MQTEPEQPMLSEAMKAEGWLPWKGDGPCPVDPETLVRYRLDGGGECGPHYAHSLDWDHIGAWNDIIAYKPEATHD